MEEGLNDRLNRLRKNGTHPALVLGGEVRLETGFKVGRQCQGDVHGRVAFLDSLKPERSTFFTAHPPPP